MLKLSGPATAIVTEGMGGRLKTKNGGLVSLKKRMNKHQMAKRVSKIAARRTIAEQLVIAHRALAFEVYRRTMRGRYEMAKLRIARFFGARQVA